MYLFPRPWPHLLPIHVGFVFGLLTVFGRVRLIQPEEQCELPLLVASLPLLCNVMVASSLVLVIRPAGCSSSLPNMIGRDRATQLQLIRITRLVLLVTHRPKKPNNNNNNLTRHIVYHDSKLYFSKFWQVAPLHSCRDMYILG